MDSESVGGSGWIGNYDGLPDLSGPTLSGPRPEAALRKNALLQGAVTRQPKHQQQDQREHARSKKKQFALKDQPLRIGCPSD